MTEKLLGQDKDREITHPLPSHEKQTHLGEVNVIYCQSVPEQNCEK